MHTTVVVCAIVESYPARQMRHGLCASPVRIVLMPRHDTAMMRRFAEQLVVPKSDGPIQQLASRNGDGWVPEQIVKRLTNSPGTQRMKQDRV